MGLAPARPINLGLDLPYTIQEGILETDWLRYDIWINIVATVPGVVVSLRRAQATPLAQLVPVRRESYEKPWEVVEQAFHRDSDVGSTRFLEWADYNHKKYLATPPTRTRPPTTRSVASTSPAARPTRRPRSDLVRGR